MSLVDHLRELRNRALVAAGAIVVATIPGWLAYERTLTLLTEPAIAQGARINIAGITDPFALQLQVALFLALLVSSPIWVYQLWAFVAPGLTAKEKRTAIAFIVVSVPLFLAGCYLAFVTLPKAVAILLGFTPQGVDNIMPASDYLGFATRFILAFGFAFLLPVFLIALNLAHVLTAATMLRFWRAAVVGLFAFAAIMTPTPDPWTMLALALPMVGLYFAACGVAALVDRRRGRDRPEWAGLGDDQASALDDGPGRLDAAEPREDDRVRRESGPSEEDTGPR